MWSQGHFQKCPKMANNTQILLFQKEQRTRKHNTILTARKGNLRVAEGRLRTCGSQGPTLSIKTVTCCLGQLPSQAATVPHSKPSWPSRGENSERGKWGKSTWGSDYKKTWNYFKGSQKREELCALSLPPSPARAFIPCPSVSPCLPSPFSQEAVAWDPSQGAPSLGSGGRLYYHTIKASFNPHPFTS